MSCNSVIAVRSSRKMAREVEDHAAGSRMPASWPESNSSAVAQVTL